MIASSRVTAEGATPAKWMLFLHGILGTGGNWRSFAQKLVKSKPAWGAILIDLRNHGASRDGFSPPHSIAACAEDLAGFECAAVLGHSFGGKVALEFSKHRDLERVFVIDSTPAPRKDRIGTDYGAYDVIRTLRTLPKTLPKRDDFIRTLTKAKIEINTAQWLAMNVRRREDGLFDLPLDLDAIHQMLDDYFSVDLWDAAEKPGVHFVAGSRGSMSEEDRARTRAEIVDAGHWVHVDSPDRLLAIVRSRLE